MPHRETSHKSSAINPLGLQPPPQWPEGKMPPCLHQNLEEEMEGLESSQDRVSKESIACRSEPANSDARNWNRLSSDSASG